MKNLRVYLFLLFLVSASSVFAFGKNMIGISIATAMDGGIDERDYFVLDKAKREAKEKKEKEEKKRKEKEEKGKKDKKRKAS